MPDNNRAGRKDMDHLEALAAASGLTEEAVLKIANGVATAIESDKSAECYIAASEEDQVNIALAYFDHYQRMTKEFAIQHHNNPEPLNSYILARVSA